MDLQPLSLESKPLVNDFLHRFPPVISEFTFTNLFVWQQTRPLWFAEFAGSLLFFTKTANGLALFGPPLGPVGLAALLAAFSGEISELQRFPKAALPEATLPGITISEDRDNADYVHRTSDLASLPGRNFAKKRNHVNQCLNSYDCRYETITPQSSEECLALQERWCTARHCAVEPGLSGEDAAISETLRHYGELELLGGAIRINGVIEAFAIGEALNPTTAVCHFEKAMPGYHGLAQLINHWFAGHELGDFAFVNREQDLGIPGLRRAKQSYHPDHLVEKVRITLDSTGVTDPAFSP